MLVKRERGGGWGGLMYKKLFVEILQHIVFGQNCAKLCDYATLLTLKFETRRKGCSQKKLMTEAMSMVEFSS